MSLILIFLLSFWSRTCFRRYHLTRCWHPQVKLIGRQEVHLHTTGFEVPSSVSSGWEACGHEAPETSEKESVGWQCKRSHRSLLMTKLGKYQVRWVGRLVLLSTRNIRQSFDATGLLVSISFQLLTSQSQDSQHITNSCAFCTSVWFITAWWHMAGYFETLWSLWPPFLPPPLSLLSSLLSMSACFKVQKPCQPL
jgi:hypothetical protein